MIASIRGKKPHVYRVIILKQMADHSFRPRRHRGTLGRLHKSDMAGQTGHFKNQKL